MALDPLVLPFLPVLLAVAGVVVVTRLLRSLRRLRRRDGCHFATFPPSMELEEILLV